MKSLAVRVLSDFAVDGIEPQALGSRKARLALQLLALAGGQAVSSDVLIDALWPGAPPARPEDQLAVLMSRLRSVLGRDRIEHRDQGYWLRCDWLDATELAVLAKEVEARREAGNAMGAVAAARVALSLIRGEGPQPLPGEWAQLKQRRARAADRPDPAGRGHGPARGGRLDGRRRRRVGRAGTRSLRRGGAARPAARLRHGRPGGRGAGRLRQRPRADGR